MFSGKSATTYLRSIIADIDYDWGYYESLDIEVGSLDLDVAMDDAELADATDFVESQDLDLTDDFAAANLDGIEEPRTGELDDPIFDGGAELQPDLDPAPEAELQPDLQPETEPDIEPEPELRPEPEPDLGDDDLAAQQPMEEDNFDPGGGFDDGGFDDGGFDDVDGGFDF